MSPRARALPLLVPLVLLVPFVLAAAAAAAPQYVASTPFAPALEHGNGNKIVVGRLNTLHAVWEHSPYIQYSTSADGQSWTAPVALPSGVWSKHPAIAVDSSGNVGVAWVGDASGVGPLYYARKPYGSTTWSTSSLGVSGAEPSLIASGATMHLAWTQIQRVRYGKFPALSPPSSLASEIVEATACTASGFRKPALALVNDPCKPAIVRIGYLHYSDEQALGSSCPSPITRIGPHVSQRDNTAATWTVVYSNELTSSVATSAVEPVSLSMAANFSSGITTLAWSDVQNGVARTQLAQRQATTWVVAPFDSQRHHVHVRVNSAPGAPPSEFRLAWTGGGSFDPFFSTLTAWTSATWTGAAPLWATATPLGGGLLAGRPQTLFWKRCAAGQLTTTDAFHELEQPCFTSSVVTDVTTSAPCPGPGSIGTAVACKGISVAVGTLMLNGLGGPKSTVVDLTDVGTITDLGATWAVAQTPDQRRVSVSWSSGALLASSDATLTLSAPRADVAIRGEGFQLPILELGHLPDYDTAQPPLEARCLKAADGQR